MSSVQNGELYWYSTIFMCILHMSRISSYYKCACTYDGQSYTYKVESLVIKVDHYIFKSVWTHCIHDGKGSVLLEHVHLFLSQKKRESGVLTYVGLIFSAL